MFTRGGWEHFVGGGVAVFDCSGDGLPEIVAAGGDAPVVLLRNGGDMAFTKGAFPEITRVTGVFRALEEEASSLMP